MDDDDAAGILHYGLMLRPETMAGRIPAPAATGQIPAPVTLLFLIADTGGGHRAAAQAVSEALERGYPGRFATVLCDPVRRPGCRAAAAMGHRAIWPGDPAGPRGSGALPTMPPIHRPRCDSCAKRCIAGMTERAEAFGGRLQTGPRPGGGFRVHARLPARGGSR